MIMCGRVEPEQVSGLLRQDLEGDPSALRYGGAYDASTVHQERAASKALPHFDQKYEISSVPTAL